jgi:hypothetical protein
MHGRCRACARFLAPAYCCHLTVNKPQPEILLPNCCQFRVCNHAFSFALVRNLPRENGFRLWTESVLQAAVLDTCTAVAGHASAKFSDRIFQSPVSHKSLTNNEGIGAAQGRYGQEWTDWEREGKCVRKIPKPASTFA